MKRQYGFTLIEVMVALVIAAIGLGAVLATLTASANNIAIMRERTLAEWAAMNQMTSMRMSPQLPTPGVTEGDVLNFARGDWHWRQEVVAVDAVPGVLRVTVYVRRLGDTKSDDPDAASGSAQGPGNGSLESDLRSSTALSSSSGAGIGGSGTGFGGTGSGLGSSSGIGSSGGFLGSSSGGSSGGSVKGLGGASSSGGGGQAWEVTLIGFRGAALAAADGQGPWTSANANATAVTPPATPVTPTTPATPATPSIPTPTPTPTDSGQSP